MRNMGFFKKQNPEVADYLDDLEKRISALEEAVFESAKEKKQKPDKEKPKGKK